ncbi:hypothetical protein J1N09_03195 [Aureitalea sp. L0-47]|uniref:hypothetical protein n=1 Tax=Aureitalea sp. L0-47 TaxID=2816962 RepID=UPI002238D917|nr:hypothetical protein [Aureitalea sp. L0-47]MCW5518828.1 hypothetical protein [Aureitalea sp. L0-47]
MKLVIVTAVSEFRDAVKKLLGKAGIESFSGSEIEGFNQVASVAARSGWFQGSAFGADSELYFSFTENEKIERLFYHIEQFNTELETNNPIRAAVIPIEKFI